jgi:hypothetical protein
LAAPGRFPDRGGRGDRRVPGEGLHVQVDLRLDTFARLHVTDPDEPGRQHRVELVANWRAQPPVQMDIGPVLHADGVMAGKMDALYNRAAARDFLDVDAAIASGRYTLEHLCDLAYQADAGFDRQLFAAMLGRIERLDDEDFTDYGVEHRPAMRSPSSCDRSGRHDLPVSGTTGTARSVAWQRMGSWMTRAAGYALAHQYP